MKLPNGYGTVTKLSGKRRRPWMIREGRSGNQKVIGYAATKQEALQILADYNGQPWNLDAAGMTFSDIWDMWIQRRAPSLLQEITIARLVGAYHHTAALWKVKYARIRPYQFQDVIDSCPAGYGTKSVLRTIFRHLETYALDLDVIQKRRTDGLTIPPADPKEKTPFSDQERARLWDHSGDPWVDSVLFLLFTGWRIREALALRVEDVDLAEGVIRGGSKTAAGKNRIVPIHPAILPIVEGWVASSRSGYLIENTRGGGLSYQAYKPYWKRVMKSLDMQHTPHECRHTLRTRLDAAGANRVCIDRIMGHSSGNVGERVYTHKTIEELREAIQLVTK